MLRPEPDRNGGQNGQKRWVGKAQQQRAEDRQRNGVRDETAQMAQSIDAPDGPRPAKLMPKQLGCVVLVRAVSHDKGRYCNSVTSRPNRPPDFVIIRQALAERGKAADFRENGLPDRDG